MVFCVLLIPMGINNRLLFWTTNAICFSVEWTREIAWIMEKWPNKWNIARLQIHSKLQMKNCFESSGWLSAEFLLKIHHNPYAEHMYSYLLQNNVLVKLISSIVFGRNVNAFNFFFTRMTDAFRKHQKVAISHSFCYAWN